MKKERVEKLVREQIARAIEYDIQEGESLMKECFERMDTDEDFEHCYAEMRRIANWLKAGGK